MNCRNNAHRTCARRTNGLSDFLVVVVMGCRTYERRTYGMSDLWASDL